MSLAHALGSDPYFRDRPAGVAGLARLEAAADEGDDGRSPRRFPGALRLAAFPVTFRHSEGGDERRGTTWGAGRRRRRCPRRPLRRRSWSAPSWPAWLRRRAARRSGRCWSSSLPAVGMAGCVANRLEGVLPAGRSWARQPSSSAGSAEEYPSFARVVREDRRPRDVGARHLRSRRAVAARRRVGARPRDRLSRAQLLRSQPVGGSSPGSYRLQYRYCNKRNCGAVLCYICMQRFLSTNLPALDWSRRMLKLTAGSRTAGSSFRLIVPAFGPSPARSSSQPRREQLLAPEHRLAARSHLLQSRFPAQAGD